MPHSIFFTKRGHAIHGSFETRKLGRPASGGCVRLAPENARVLFNLVKAEGVLKTKVTITGDERVALARADRQLTQRGAGQAERGAGLPPTYSPPVEDEPRARQRQALPRQAYGAPYGQSQQQYYYDGYQWRPYQGQTYRPQPQPYYGGYAQPQYYYQPRYRYD
jgi:lipoprotein-anchoring transpeptidase ErfK/SrfK